MKREPKRRKNKKEKYITWTALITTYGFTRALVNKYLPKPRLMENPTYRSAAPMKLWRESDVEKALRIPEVEAVIRAKRERAERKAEKERKEKKEMADFLALFDIEQYRLRAEKLNRRFVLHVGPTNSGKTYEALKALKTGGRGVYLGPLRLLALEMYDTLNEEGHLCELLTGEEYVSKEGALITSSTIELCDFHEEYDAAVIDEAQMISDSFRGDKWTKAIYLIRAKEIHICLAPEAENLLREMLEGFHADYTVIYHKRLAPLEYSGGVKNISDVRDGDAVIVFSRRAVLATAAELQNMGLHASVIYGALPPLSRREEVRKFIKGENTVVVATDAIGMGISLPIKRIVFRELSKFDGEERRSLQSGEIKQIAGRAGRFGIYDKGEVASMASEDFVKEAITIAEEPLKRIVIPFPTECLETDYPLDKLMHQWQSLPRVPGFERADLSDAMLLFHTLGKDIRYFDRKLLYKLITCPVDTKNDVLIYYWLNCCRSIGKGIELPEPTFDTATLEGCEQQYKALDIRHQLLRQIGLEEDRMEEKAELCTKINRFLLENKRNYLRQCRICGKSLPATYEFGICEKCYKERNRYHGVRF